MTLQKWNRLGISMACGLTACLMTSGLFAQSSASVGIARITDRVKPASRRAIQQGSNSRIRQVNAQRGTLVEPAPYTYSNSRSAMTGNPVVDLIRTASNSRRAAAPSDSSCSSCQQSASCSSCGDSGCSSCGDGGCNSCGGSGCSSCGLFGCGLFGCCGSKCGHSGCESGECDNESNFSRMLRDISRADISHKTRCFGHMGCDGCGGQGCPPHGHYHLLYSANPRYFDSRDGRVYAAQGYGIPMAVPLAPNVRHTYNYGWGIPSSRLTPISTRAPF